MLWFWESPPGVGWELCVSLESFGFSHVSLTQSIKIWLVTTTKSLTSCFALINRSQLIISLPVVPPSCTMTLHSTKPPMHGETSSEISYNRLRVRGRTRCMSDVFPSFSLLLAYLLLLADVSPSSLGMSTTPRGMNLWRKYMATTKSG
jgi:hypothetical protein